MLDSRQKRAAVVGVGRAWYRNAHPSSIDAAQRASIGQVYPVADFQDVSDFVPLKKVRRFIQNVNRIGLR